MLTKADRCQEMLGPFQCELKIGHEQRCKFDSPTKRTTAKADLPIGGWPAPRLTWYQRILWRFDWLIAELPRRWRIKIARYM